LATSEEEKKKKKGKKENPEGLSERNTLYQAAGARTIVWMGVKGGVDELLVLSLNEQWIGPSKADKGKGGKAILWG